MRKKYYIFHIWSTLAVDCFSACLQKVISWWNAWTYIYIYMVLCGCFCAVFGCCIGLIAPYFSLLAAKTMDEYSTWSMINILWGKSGAAETRKNAYLCCLLAVCVFPLKTIVSLKVWHDIDRMKKIKYALIKISSPLFSMKRRYELWLTGLFLYFI